MSRLTLALIALVLTNSCGLLFEPTLPSLDEVNLAKIAQSDEWTLLGECFFLLQENFEDGRGEVASKIATYPEYPRLSLLLQDFEIMHLQLDELFEYYRKLEGEQSNALSALLFARVNLDRDKRIEYAEKSLASDPQFAIAKVFELGTRAEDGEADLVDELVSLLDDNPGCAEGWRLLAQLAPLYANSDYAVAAALTEPWVLDKESALYKDSKTVADKDAAVKLLQVGELDKANSRLLNIDDEVFVKLAKASVYARDHNPVEALLLITEVIEIEPDNHVAIFNRALLYRDYFGYDAVGKFSDVSDLNDARCGDLLPGDIRQAEIDDLTRFLELTKSSSQDSLLRRTQAEYRLRVAKKQLD
jgi:hypothetical protein